MTGLLTIPSFSTQPFDLRYNFLILPNLINLSGDPMNPRNEHNSPFRHREPILTAEKSFPGLFLDFWWKTTPARKIEYCIDTKNAKHRNIIVIIDSQFFIVCVSRVTIQ